MKNFNTWASLEIIFLLSIGSIFFFFEMKRRIYWHFSSHGSKEHIITNAEKALVKVNIYSRFRKPQILNKPGRDQAFPNLIKEVYLQQGSSLAVQWLGHYTSPAGAPVLQTKILRDPACWAGQSKPNQTAKPTQSIIPVSENVHQKRHHQYCLYWLLR